jgi:hypothetical protein
LTRFFGLLLALSFCISVSGVARASTQRAERYLSTRNSAKITSLTLSQARKSTGHQGQIVEWAGTIQGVSLTAEGMFMFLRLTDGQTIPMRASQSGALALGTRVYVIGKVIEKSGLIHHLEPLAVAPCTEVRSAYDDAQKVAARRAAERKRATAAAAPALHADPRALAARAGTLSLHGAIGWIKEFNRGISDSDADALARTILYYCGQYGVDSRLALSLFAAESCFHEDATSPVGAMGIGQLMPDTASMLGVRDPYNAFQNVEGSIRHISTLLDHWRGSPVQYQLTLASYNAGAGAVEQYGGIPPYPETVNYVKTILGYYGELCHYQ